MRKDIAIVIVVLILAGGAWFLFRGAPPTQEASALTELAQCLTQKGAVMYGAEWCSHCQNQKKMFGDGWQYVTYVECPDEPDRCLEAGVESYPTWAFADGTTLRGEQSAEELARVSGCAVGEGDQETRRVTLYYYNANRDRDAQGNIQCSRAGLVPLIREIPVTQTPIQDTVRLLLEGELTPEERTAGITTEFPLPDVRLAGASLRDGVLTFEFTDPGSRTSGGACRAGILWFQIEATAKQFPEAESVRFIPEELFQP